MVLLYVVAFCTFFAQHFNDDSSFGSCDHNVFDTVQLTDPAYLSYQKKNECAAMSNSLHSSL